MSEPGTRAGEDVAAEIVCARCGQSRPPVGAVPLPGELGEEVARRVCAECWGEWVHTSIRVINHYGLQPALKEHREKLFELMRDFLQLGSTASERP